MLLRDAAPFDVWAISNYRWTEPFLWIVALAALFMGMFLFASYLKTRNKSQLLWTFGFLGIFVFYHTLLASESLEALAGAFSTSMFGLQTALLLPLIPGLFAAGLCYDKDEKLGKSYTIFTIIFSLGYLIMQLMGNTGVVPKYDLIATIFLILVQLISAIIIIALPLKKEGPLFPKNLLTIGGIFMLATNIMMSIQMITATYSGGLRAADGGTLDIMFAIIPFFITIYILCFIYAIFGTKEFGFEIPHVEFEEEK
ncbi:MAG: hypothetical protein DRO88_09110 [Promethearchaeia archaeon]|nr:MAG: hypothetical protein DRO88_09110 [Candidatus Lokiarchaeia archaeon]